MAGDGLPMVESMSVRLISEDGTIDIQSQSEAVQLAIGHAVGLDAPPIADFGRWMWLVTARKPGRHSLLVRVSGTLRDQRGVVSDAALPDRQLEVLVRTHAGHSILQAVAQLSRVLRGLRSSRST